MSQLDTNTTTLQELLEIANALPEAGSGKSFPNGTEWTQSNMNTGYSKCIYYTNGIWVAVTDQGPYYSTDGKTWSPSNINGISSGSLVYSNGVWAISTIQGVYYSTDGKTWSPSNITGFRCGYLRYTNGIWFVLNTTNSQIYCSTDGKTWTQSTSALTYRDVKYRNGIWVMAVNGTKKGSMYYSTDGENWTASNIQLGDSFAVVEYIDEFELWVAGSGSNDRPSLYYSNDGKTWTVSDTAPLGSIKDICYANGVLLACGTTSVANGKAILCRSTDGKTWTVQVIETGLIGSVKYANGVWVLSSSKNLYYSTDALTWIKTNITDASFAPDRNSLYCNNGIWICSLYNYGLLYSVVWEP